MADVALPVAFELEIAQEERGPVRGWFALAAERAGVEAAVDDGGSVGLIFSEDPASSTAAPTVGMAGVAVLAGVDVAARVDRDAMRTYRTTGTDQPGVGAL